MQPQNIIFLDIDGVLNSLAFFKNHPNAKDIDPQAVVRLSKIYHNFDCKIVLASTWRTLPETHSLYQFLLQTFASYDMTISDKTPMLNDIRPCEIKEWLNTHEHANFVILDDDFPQEDYATYGLDTHLVHTIFFTYEEMHGGLQDFHFEQIEKILGNPNVRE